MLEITFCRRDAGLGYFPFIALHSLPIVRST